MKYMLLLFDAGDWTSGSEEDFEREMAKHASFAQWCGEHNVAILGGEALNDPETGVTIDRRKGEEVVTDGAFAELKENLGGFYLIECEGLDLAVEAARQCPISTATEIRPVFEREDGSR